MNASGKFKHRWDKTIITKRTTTEVSSSLHLSLVSEVETLKAIICVLQKTAESVIAINSPLSPRNKKLLLQLILLKIVNHIFRGNSIA